MLSIGGEGRGGKGELRHMMMATQYLPENSNSTLFKKGIMGTVRVSKP